MKYKKAKLFSIKYLVHDFIKVTAALPGIIAFRPKYIFSSKAARKRIRGGAVVIGNHSGFFDPVFMQIAIWYRRHHFICTKDLFVGKKRFLFKSFLCIPIDRENVGISSIRQITEHLRDGEIVTLFPEGKIEDGLKSFKSGMVLIALQSKAPIIPVYIQHRTSIFKRLVIAIGEPIDVIDECGDRPSINKIESITEMLYEQEKHLEDLCNAH